MTAKKNSLNGSLKTNISDLFEELRSAIYWQRPSILLAVYRSIWTQQKASDLLGEMLTKAGSKVVALEFNQLQPSFTHRIVNQAQPENPVYFIFNLDHGGDNNRVAYQALNMYRELFVENQIKAVFWLSRQEAAAMPLLAPDFWAFRHRVIELGGAHAKPLKIPWSSLALWYAEPGAARGPDEHIHALEKSLKELPVGPDGLSLRIQLLYEIGYACWNSEQMDKSHGVLMEGLDLAVSKSLSVEIPRFLNGKAIHHLYSGQYGLASDIFTEILTHDKKDGIAWMNLGIAFCAQGKNYLGASHGRKAIRMEPDNARLWNRLGYLHVSAGTLNEALLCFESAIRFSPDEAGYHESLAACYHLLGWTERALTELETVVRMDEKRYVLVDIYRQRMSGNLDGISELLRTEISGGDILQRTGFHNPNLNLFLDPVWPSKRWQEIP